ncbi:MAG TPA: hypothetical protein VLT51_11605 [Anaerolineales bacterium]|nr:hypothetical protein [Anaerolineales bacterium]
MSDLFSPDLSSVAETLLIPLYNRAMESQRPDAIMKDEKAVVLMKKIGYNFDQITKIRMFDANKVARVMLTREMDRYTQHWGFWSGKSIESWGDNSIHLLGQWGFFDQPEPRITPYRWLAPLFRLFKPIRIFHFKFGKAIG